jgi:hypothetical protein
VTVPPAGVELLAFELELPDDEADEADELDEFDEADEADDADEFDEFDEFDIEEAVGVLARAVG